MTSVEPRSRVQLSSSDTEVDNCLTSLIFQGKVLDERG